MQRPIDVDMPHKLGRDEARRRIAGNIHKLRDHIPGGAPYRRAGPATGSISMSTPWARAVEARSMSRTARSIAASSCPACSLFAGPIEAMLKPKGDLLLEDKRD